MLFSNNKQQMTIIMSHNQLDFENTIRDDNEINRRISPFGDIIKMKSLDLSHNALKEIYDDWWLNGHESVDISYNNITRLWVRTLYFIPYPPKLIKTGFS